MRRKYQSVQLLEKFALLVKKRIILPSNVYIKRNRARQIKPRNRKPPHKHLVNQFDFEETGEKILSVSFYEEEINAIDNPSNKIQRESRLAIMKVGGKNVNWVRCICILGCSAHQISPQRSCG